MPSTGGTSITILDKVLKDFFLPPVVEQLNNEILLLQRLEARDQEISGRQAIVPLHTGRSGGIGARGEYVQLPEATAQAYDRAVYTLKYLYGVVRVSGPSIELTASEAGSFVQALKSELDGIRNDLKKDTSRQLYANGDGIIATFAANASVNVLVGQTTGANPMDQAIAHGWIYVGQVVDGGTVASPQTRFTTRNVTAVNSATPSVTIDGAAVTTSAGEILTRQGSNFANGTYEMSGLGQLNGSAANTFGGINASTSAYWDNQRDTAGTAITEDRLMRGFNKVRVAGGEVSAIVTGFANQRVFWNSLLTLRRFNDPMKFESGFQTLDFMGKPLIADIDCPFNAIHLLDERFIKVFTNRDWHFLDQDNSTLKWDASYDAWKAVLTRYINLGASRRNVQMLLTTDQVVGF